MTPVCALAQEVVAVNCGGREYTTVDGLFFQSDQGFNGGSTYRTTQVIEGTLDGRLYRTERYGNFNRTFAVSNGPHVVKLSLAEIYWSDVGQRVFNVLINGTTVLDSFDILAYVAPMTALDLFFPVMVTNGEVVIEFVTLVNNAKCSAIAIGAVPTGVGQTIVESPVFTSLGGTQ